MVVTEMKVSDVLEIMMSDINVGSIATLIQAVNNNLDKEHHITGVISEDKNTAYGNRIGKVVHWSAFLDYKVQVGSISFK